MTIEPVIIEAKEGELLPCPFCGSPASFEHDATGSAGAWRVYCRDTTGQTADDGCAIALTNSDDYARRCDAAAAWNKRVHPPAQEAQRERMWCLSCGTVSRDGSCDCKFTPDAEPNWVNYADQLQRDFTELYQEHLKLKDSTLNTTKPEK